MSAQRTPREQYIGLANGIQSDYLLQFTYGPGPNPYSKRPPLMAYVGPGFLHVHKAPPGGKDVWGVQWVCTRETSFGPIPEPNNFLLKDITKWRDVIKAPDISGLDWEKMAKNDLEFQASLGIDRNKTALCYTLNFGYFQQLIAFMGFTEGLCAIQEEPEEVQALMEYMSDFYIKVAKKSIDYYKPDLVHVIDDTAAWASPFVSPAQYRELFKPYHAKEAKLGVDRGLPVQMHNCGKCECFIDDWIDFGVKFWDPAQECNDLVGIQKKYGNQMIIVGGIDIMGDLASPHITEAEYKQKIIEKIDKYTKNNAFFIFDGWVFGDPDDTVLNNKNRWSTEVVEDYGAKIFK